MLAAGAAPFIFLSLLCLSFVAAVTLVPARLIQGAHISERISLATPYFLLFLQCYELHLSLSLQKNAVPRKGDQGVEKDVANLQATCSSCRHCRALTESRFEQQTGNLQVEGVV